MAEVLSVAMGGEDGRRLSIAMAEVLSVAMGGQTTRGSR